jgi:hypothetical protein
MGLSGVRDVQACLDHCISLDGIEEFRALVKYQSSDGIQWLAWIACLAVSYSTQHLLPPQTPFLHASQDKSSAAQLACRDGGINAFALPELCTIRISQLHQQQICRKVGMAGSLQAAVRRSFSPLQSPLSGAHEGTFVGSTNKYGTGPRTYVP